MAVLLDVVYNHFGPDGNYLSVYAPQFFTAKHKTPWGDAINYDGVGSAAVRDFVVHNALYWLQEFHVDGLRLDAIHSIIDDSETPLVVELAERVRLLDVGRPVPILVENEDNDAADLVRVAGAPKRYTAQWNDDVHHVLHTAATGEATGYYADYVGDTSKLGRALAEGFAFQGELMAFRGSARGEPSASLPPDAFVSFTQNHDQIGTRALGDRLAATAPPAAVRAVTAVCLLLPQVPMLFMGEEWGTFGPFHSSAISPATSAKPSARGACRSSSTILLSPPRAHGPMRSPTLRPRRRSGQPSWIGPRSIDRITARSSTGTRAFWRPAGLS